MRKRSQASVVYTDFMQSPAKYRGRLVRLELNVRRVLSYPVENSPVGVQRIYEIWGYTDESRGWLYDVVTSQLPEGMPTGANVHERASFVGYFFKLQGYHEAGAKPRAAPLRAPLLVGRLAWHPQATDRTATDDRVWLWAIGGGLAVALAGIVLWTSMQQRRALRRRAAQQQLRNQAVAEWLDRDRSTGDWALSDDESSDDQLESCEDSDIAIARDVERSPNGNHKPSAHKHRT